MIIVIIHFSSSTKMSARGGLSLPSGFNFTDLNRQREEEARLNQQAEEEKRFQTEVSQASKYILEQFQKFSNAEKPYFQVILTEYLPATRVVIIQELANRFPAIGYRVPPEQDTLQTELRQIEMIVQFIAQHERGIHVPITSSNQRQPVKKLRTPADAAQFTHFLVPLTSETVSILETFTW